MLRVVCCLIAGALAFAQDAPRNTWAEQYQARTPDEMAKQFETPSRPVFRYRAAITGLMQLKPGMTAAEIGAGSGFLARMMAQQVGASGKWFPGSMRFASDGNNSQLPKKPTPKKFPKRPTPKVQLPTF